MEVTHAELEREHVHEVYDKIAAHFSSTRYKPWPLVEQFLQSLPCGTLLADVGCGNGKYLHVNPLCYPIGSDRSTELTAICGERGFESVVADNLNLPYRSSACFDAVISIAVIHHMASEERRVQAVKELGRILKPGGSMLITVWAFEQKDKKYHEQDVFVPWHLQKKFVAGRQQQAPPKKRAVPKRTRKQRMRDEAKGLQLNQEEEQHTGGDTRVAKENSDKSEKQQQQNEDAETSRLPDEAQVFKRYYHLFVNGELERIVRAAGGLSVVESAFDHDNWYIRVTKDEYAHNS